MYRMFRILLITLSFALVLAVATAPAGADVLLNNLDPANTGLHTVKGPGGTAGIYGETRGGVSFSIAPGTDYYLNLVTIGAKYVSGSATSFQLALYGDDGSGLPGSQITSRTLVVDSSGVFKPYTADFGSLVLSAGTTYWAIVQAPSSSDIQLAVQRGTSLDSSRRAMFGNMGETYPNGDPKEPYWMHMWTAGFEITGSPVPEPSGLVAIIGGLGCLSVLKRRRR